MPLKFSKSLLAVALLCALGSMPVKSDVLEGASQTSWDPNKLYNQPGYVPGLYYWNNSSGDGSQANIGWCLTGSSQCGMSNPPGLLPYYSVAGSAPSNMYFTSVGGMTNSSLQLTLTDQKGGGSGVDFFGYYVTDATGTTIGTPTVLFTSTQPNGTSVLLGSLPAGENYGFFIENVQGFLTPQQSEYTYYMDSAANTSTGVMPADTLQHFAIFSGDGLNYYIGANDADACQGNVQPGTTPCIPQSEFDYNDIVVELSPTAPEPATFILLGGGLLALAALRRRRT